MPRGWGWCPCTNQLCTRISVWGSGTHVAPAPGRMAVSLCTVPQSCCTVACLELAVLKSERSVSLRLACSGYLHYNGVRITAVYTRTWVTVFILSDVLPRLGVLSTFWWRLALSPLKWFYPKCSQRERSGPNFARHNRVRLN